jgi:hypothetical protein
MFCSAWENTGTSVASLVVWGPSQQLVVPVPVGVGVRKRMHATPVDLNLAETTSSVPFLPVSFLLLFFWHQIKGPDDKPIYDGERETDGKYTFSAHMDGRYKYCFSNLMSTMTPKLVVFNMNVGKPQGSETETGEGEYPFRWFGADARVLSRTSRLDRSGAPSTI